MERKGPPISLDEFRRRFGNQTNPEGRLTRLQQITAVQRDAQQALQAAQERFGQIDEDAYATRNEASKLVGFLGHFNHQIARVKPGGTVDLTRTVVDYGYDPEDAAAAMYSGVDYRTGAEQAEAEYALHLHAVGKFLPQLKKAGVTIKVGFRRIPPDLLPTDPDKKSEEG